MLTEYAQILSEMRNALDEFSKGYLAAKFVDGVPETGPSMGRL
jgi:hypothetical protein